MIHEFLKSEKNKQVELAFLQEELDNFVELAQQITPGPGNIPLLDGFKIFGGTLPLHSKAGGDHIIYLDFNNRYDLDGRIRRAEADGNSKLVRELERSKNKAGVMVADVSGHRITDAYISAMLHQAFLLGVLYELEINGTISVKLFETINSRFYRSSSINRFITMIYGEIHHGGKFRFISAAHPLPLVFSAEFGKIVNIHPERMTRFPPIGTLPSKMDPDKSREKTPLPFKEDYQVHEIELLSPGDILVLFSDGFEEHSDKHENYIETRLETKLSEGKYKTPKELFEDISKDMLAFAPQKDDISMVFIKRCL
jgi:serine phosphatase RsbU (regulator of sigma subunit)